MAKESIQDLRVRLLRDEQVHTMIRMRAFEIYQDRGGQPGNAQHDWLQAENEILTYLIREESQLDLAADPKPGKVGTTKSAKGAAAKSSVKAKAKSGSDGAKAPAKKKTTKKKKADESKDS
jgi:hypothetical protein